MPVSGSHKKHLEKRQTRAIHSGNKWALHELTLLSGWIIRLSVSRWKKKAWRDEPPEVGGSNVSNVVHLLPLSACIIFNSLVTLMNTSSYYGTMSNTGHIMLKRCDPSLCGIDCLVVTGLPHLGHVLKSNLQQKILAVSLVHLFNKYFLNVDFVYIHTGTGVKISNLLILKILYSDVAVETVNK